MAKDKFIIRNMTEQEVKDIAIQWAKEQGWNPGLHDTESFYAQDPQGFFVATIGNEPIGCASAVTYDNDFAFFGFYMVVPEFRGQGYGFEITKKRLAYVGDRNLGLDGVVNMCDKYENIGFVKAHLNVRYEGVLDKPYIHTNKHIHHISNTIFHDIALYDQKYFPAPREIFLQHWLFPKEGKALVYQTANQDIQGYGVIRKCFKGYKIGPLFAENHEIAEELFLQLISETHGEPFYLDIPEPNKYARALVNKYHMKSCFETIRMYTKGAPKINLNNVFGITTFELG